MIRDLLDKTLTLQRGSRATNGIGGNRPVFTNVAGMVDVECMMYPATTRTRQAFQGDQMTVDYEVVTEDDIGARREDRIVIDGKTYTVVGYKPFEHEPTAEEGVYVAVVSRQNAQ